MVGTCGTQEFVIITTYAATTDHGVGIMIIQCLQQNPLGTVKWGNFGWWSNFVLYRTFVFVQYFLPSEKLFGGKLGREKLICSLLFVWKVVCVIGSNNKNIMMVLMSIGNNCCFWWYSKCSKNQRFICRCLLFDLMILSRPLFWECHTNNLFMFVSLLWSVQRVVYIVGVLAQFLWEAQAHKVSGR